MLTSNTEEKNREIRDKPEDVTKTITNKEKTNNMKRIPNEKV